MRVIPILIILLVIIFLSGCVSNTNELSSNVWSSDKISKANEYCNKISDDDALRRHCLETVTVLDNPEKEIKRCDSTTDEYTRNSCYFSIPQIINSSRTCEKITETTLNKNTPRSDCFLYAARKTSDASLCEKITDAIDRIVPCYSVTAEMNNDTRICEKIKYSSMKEKCLSGGKDSILCRNVKEAYYYNEKRLDDRYNLCMAKVVGDLNYCERINRDEIQGDYYKQTCYKEVARVENNKTICEQITNIESKNNCYISIAYNSKDSSVCNFVSTTSKTKCKIYVAASSQNADICESIDDTKYKDKCYWLMAFKAAGLMVDSDLSEPAVNYFN